MADPQTELPPEQFADYTDDEVTPVTLGYEGNKIPFFLVLIWIGMIIGVLLYVVRLAVPDAIDWLG